MIELDETVNLTNSIKCPNFFIGMFCTLIFLSGLRTSKPAARDKAFNTNSDPRKVFCFSLRYLFIFDTPYTSRRIDSIIIKTSTYWPIFSFSVVNLFWSTFRMVSFESKPMPSGRVSITFWDKCKSVSFSNPPTSSGKSSNRFSETSRQTKFLRFPISCKQCTHLFQNAQIDW